MPNLTDYLDTKTETQSAFAARAGLSNSTLSRLLKGRIPPSPEVVEKVRAATEGEVTANDLYESWRAARQAEEGQGGPDQSVTPPGEVA